MEHALETRLAASVKDVNCYERQWEIRHWKRRNWAPRGRFQQRACSRPAIDQARGVQRSNISIAEVMDSQSARGMQEPLLEREREDVPSSVTLMS